MSYFYASALCAFASGRAAMFFAAGRLWAASLLAVAAAVISVPAVAAGKAPAASTGAGPVVDPTPLIAVVSIGDQHVTIWQGDRAIARSPISSGMDGHRTPLGVFSVIGKERYHESNIYSGAPMPFMQRITWSGIAMHAGALPGYPASHGCIRMPESFAQRLYGMTHMGMRVIVAAHDLSPVAVAYPQLPAPTFVRATELALADQTGGVQPVAFTGRMQLGGPATMMGDRLLNPMETGKLERERTRLAVQQAAIDARVLVQLAAQHSDDARIAADAARDAANSLAAIDRGLAMARLQAADPTVPDDQHTRAVAEVAALEAAHRDAVQRRDRTRQIAEEEDALAFRVAAEAKAAIAEQERSEQAAHLADHATEPVSVFVSRRERRVFVRQGFEPLFDAEVEIVDQDTPIGTHVFTATAPATDGGGMSWVSLTVPGTAGGARRDEPKARLIKAAADVAHVAAPLPPTAANALARIKFTDAIRQKISERLWTGASLIISDYGISGETGQGTDFVVLTR